MIRGTLAVGLFVTALVFGMATPVAAQAETESAGEDRATSFRAVEGAVQEDVPGGPLLIGAYGIIWLVVFGYVIRLVRMQKSGAEELKRLEASLRASAKEGGE